MTSAPRYAEDTDVSVERSRAEIERLLRRHGATQFGSATNDDEGTAWVVFKLEGRMFRLEVRRPRPEQMPKTPAPTAPEKTPPPSHAWNRDQHLAREKREADDHAKAMDRWREKEKLRALRWIEQEERRRWRAQLLLVKAKLEMIATGETTVEREFLADMLTADGRTIGKQLGPVIERMYATGKMPATLLLGPGVVDGEVVDG